MVSFEKAWRVEVDKAQKRDIDQLIMLFILREKKKSEAIIRSCDVGCFCIVTTLVFVAKALFFF